MTRAEAEEALRKALARLRPGGCAAAMTLADLVEEYLEMHQGEPVTIAKLRWLLGKATASLGAVKLADVPAKDIYAWRQTIPEPKPSASGSSARPSGVVGAGAEFPAGPASARQSRDS